MVSQKNFLNKNVLNALLIAKIRKSFKKIKLLSIFSRSSLPAGQVQGTFKRLHLWIVFSK